MLKKKTAVLLLILVSVFVTVILIQTKKVFLSHEAAVSNTVAQLLAKNDQSLPAEPADLAMLDQQPTIALKQITTWEAEQVDLKNTANFSEAIRDDDPIYHLQADLQVTFADGSQATLSWESWRYGLVIGSVVVSLGDGPPGFITAVADK